MIFFILWKTRLPDGIFSNQKSQFGKILECLVIRDVVKCYWPFLYFTAFLVYFPHLGMLYQQKSGNPGGKDTVMKFIFKGKIM
jgi:hypothetical protein